MQSDYSMPYSFLKSHLKPNRRTVVFHIEIILVSTVDNHGEHYSSGKNTLLFFSKGSLDSQTTEQNHNTLLLVAPM